MKYTIVFVLVLVLVSGFIAYFGDLLGRKMGKKRLTLFNLRPRYTAIVVTTITGMIISGLALTALLIIDSQFKRVFTEGERILKQNEILTGANRGLAQKNKQLVAHGDKLDAEIALQQKVVNDARKEVAAAIKAKNEALTVVINLRKEIASRKVELDGLRKANKAVNIDLSKKTLALNEVRLRLDIAWKNLKDAQNRVKVAQQAAMIREMALVDFRISDVIARQGDELARDVIPPNKTNSEIRSSIVDLLKSASGRISKLGAAVGKNGMAVSVSYRDPKKGVLIGQENEFINKAVEAVSKNRNSGTMIQVVSAGNFISGEQVLVEIKLYYNKKIYSQGDLIAQGVVDGRASEGRILLALIDFLQGQVALSGMKSGIVPVSAADPRLASSKDPQAQVDALMVIVSKIKDADSVVDINVYASEDIYAKGPLDMSNMQFKISRVY